MENKTENQLVKFRREHIGFIFQSFNLMGTMNAVENVALPLTFQGVDKDIRMKRASRVLDMVGLKEHKKHKPTQMSGGQQQRVGVARALVVNPEIIFADEPTGNLDSNTSREAVSYTHLQVWDYIEDGRITFNIVYSFEKEMQIIQREIFEETYFPIKREVLSNTLVEMGYEIRQMANFPLQCSLPIDDFEWYCILAQKRM